ncbi:ABC transporter permease [bacterium]|nr:ABC transporter permease [bacterium]
MELARQILGLFEGLFSRSGQILHLLFQTVREIPSVFRRLNATFRLMAQFGLYTLPLAAFIGFFVGMVTALQTGVELKSLGLTELVGSIVGLSLVREMGPVITAFIICGRVGAAMTAELGTMVVTEEIDVLRSMGISPVRYLIVPRFVAAMTMVPILTVYAILIGIWGGALVSTSYLGISQSIFYKRMFETMALEDVVVGVSKTFVFAAIISLVCCQFGLTSSRDAESVGRSTMNAVVVSLTSILIADFFMTRFFG